MGERLLGHRVHTAFSRLGGRSSRKNPVRDSLFIRTLVLGVMNLVEFAKRRSPVTIDYDQDQITYADPSIAAFVNVGGTSDIIGKLERHDTPSSPEYGSWLGPSLMTVSYQGWVHDVDALISRWDNQGLFSDPLVRQRVLFVVTLLGAAQGGHSKVLQLLVERGANIHSLLPSGTNVMHFAAAGGHIGVVKYLLEYQVAPDVKHDDGPTPLLLAASAGHAEVVRLLLGTGQVDVNQTSGGGRAALTWAVARGHKEVVNELMKSEAIDLNTRDGFATPLAIAAVMGQETIFEMLFADPRVDRSSHIAFWLASMGTAVSVVKALEYANSEWFYALYSNKALLLAAEYAIEGAPVPSRQRD
jgi:hypothetical protein